MKTQNLFLILLTFVFLSAQAGSLDPETQNSVIERLERIIGLMDKKDSSWNPSNLRLANLLAERARLRFMKEIEDNCKTCKGSVQDRKKALGIYEGLLKTSEPETQGNILFQMGHLYQIAGEPKKASNLFHSIIKGKKGLYTPDVVRRARTSYADILYNQGKYKEALVQYKIAMNDPDTAARGIVLYRIAWCQFNLDQLNAGTSSLEKLARSPDLLVKETEQGDVADPGFQNDVLRDLATFYARRPITAREINHYQSIIPENQRKELLFFFAGEANRIGQKSASAEIYKAYLQDPALTKEERLEVMVLLAQIEYDKGLSSKSIANFALAAKAFKNCSEDEKCLELQKKMKYYVTELHRSKKVKPDADLLKAYVIYVETFPKDTEMSLRGAQVADDIKQPKQAAALYHQSADTATDPKFRTEALHGEISAAEKSQDFGLRETAYLHYLALLPEGPKAFEVRYQMAQLSYERKNYEKAAGEFRALALDPKGPKGLRKQAADLALDAQAILKRDAEIESYAREFSAAFPAHRTEFDKIMRKAVINQVAMLVNQPKATAADYQRGLDKLNQTSLATATEPESILHFKNMFLLAEKVEDEKSLRIALLGSLRMKSLKDADKENLLARTVGFYERKLDFRNAYEYASKMKFPKLKTADRELKLGTLADLANLRPQKHYQAALRAGLNRHAEGSVRQRLILLAANPGQELRKHQSQLLQTPSIFNEVILLVYAQEGPRSLQTILTSKKHSHLSSVQFINKQSFYRKHSTIDQSIANHQFNATSDRMLQRSIKERMALLVKVDQSLAQAVSLKDFTAQIMALSTTARENQRLGDELARSPMPRGLTAQEQAKYAQLLSQQTRPFYMKAAAAQGKVQTLWKNQSFFNRLASDYQKSRTEIQSLLRTEMQILIQLSPSDDIRSQLTAAMNQGAPPTRDELLAARADVRENPTNFKQIEKLKYLETKIGHPLMSPYLQGRLEQIQKEKVL